MTEFHGSFQNLFERGPQMGLVRMAISGHFVAMSMIDIATLLLTTDRKSHGMSIVISIHDFE